MSLQPSWRVAFLDLWRKAPRWRNILLIALACTALAVLFRPAGGGPANSYTPPGQSQSGQLAPPKAGSPGGSSQPLSVVGPATPPPIKIKPSQSGEGIEVLSSSIKPSGPAVEE